MGAKKGLLAGFLQAGELHMVAGVKGVGKTTLLLNIAEEFQRDSEGFHILYYYSAPNGETSLSDELKISRREISELPLQTGHMFLDAAWAKEEGGLAAILVDDYRFLLRTEHFRKNDLSRQEKILFLLSRLKSLAEAYDVPVILSTSVDDDYVWGRSEKKLRVSDIPDYEIVEEFVDRLILLHREELFLVGSDKTGLAELILCDLTRNISRDYQLGYLGKERHFCLLEKA